MIINFSIEIELYLWYCITQIREILINIETFYKS